MSLISTRGWCPIVRASAASLTNSLAASLFIEILMVQITYIEHNGTQHNVDVPEGESLMQAAQNNMIPGIDADCGGACACATCHVFVADEWTSGLPPVSENEEAKPDRKGVV